MTDTADLEIEITDASDSSRYEIRLGGDLAGFADYRLDGNQITFPHTEIDPSQGGQGLGTKLVAFAVEDARSRGLEIVPLCPFVKDWIEKNPEDS